jgi:phosphonate transport system substrate-binding protein
MLWGPVRIFGHGALIACWAGALAIVLAVVSGQVSLLASGVWAIAESAVHPKVANAGDLESTPPSPYRLGVFPYFPVLTIDRIYGPVAAHFADDLGRPVELKTKPTFDKFAEELKKESYDIILVHPFFYVEASDKHHYLPLARVEEPLTAVVMVREDDTLETLADLEGETIGLPPALAAVSELVEGALIDAGFVPGVDVKLEHYGSKRSCLQAVAIGRVAACGVPRFVLSQFDPDNELKLRLMFETEGVAGFVFAAHARVPESDRIDISKSILAWPFTVRGRRILAGGAWGRFVVARDEDYDDVRRQVRRLHKLAQR